MIIITIEIINDFLIILPVERVPQIPIKIFVRDHTHDLKFTCVIYTNKSSIKQVDLC